MNKLLVSAAALSLALTIGCVPEDGGETPTLTDVDLDGYYLEEDDCDDSNEAINPGASEDNTDYVDYDCDGFPTAPPYAIGDYGPAGGIVFHLDNDTAGLEAAPVDQDDGTGAEWGCYYTNIWGADGTSVGTGAQNTLDMLAAACLPSFDGNDLAADLVAAYSLNGFDDWSLPSITELNLLFAQKDVVGGFASKA